MKAHLNITLWRPVSMARLSKTSEILLSGTWYCINESEWRP